MAQPVDVQLKRLPHSEGVDLPAYQSAHAAGMDLHAAVEGEVVIGAGQTAIVPCGFAMALPEGYEAQVRPRSGLAAKHAVTVANAPGTIDADYRGEVMVILINLGQADFVVTRNMRIAQMLLAPVYRIAWEETDELGDTVRGEGGFGHTGH